MLRAQLALVASSSASSTLLASSTLPTVPATLTLTPVASTPASHAEGQQYQPGDDKQLSLDISVQSSGQGMFAMFGERLHIRLAAGIHRHGQSYGEIIAKHPRMIDFFGDGAHKRYSGAYRLFLKIAKLDAHTRKNFPAPANQETNGKSCSELAADCYIRADDTYKSAYTTVNAWCLKCVQTKKVRVNCSGAGCDGSFAKTTKPTIKACLKCKITRCTTCGGDPGDIPGTCSTCSDNAQ